MRNVNVRFVPHGKFAWKLYPHSLLFLQPDSFSAHHPHLLPLNMLKNGFGCFLALSMFAESLCKSRDVERGNGEEQKQAVYFYAVSVVDIYHVDLWASTVSKAFWDSTGGLNSTHLDLNYTLLAACLRFSIEAPFSVDVQGSQLLWEKEANARYLYHQIPGHNSNTGFLEMKH